MTVANFEPKLWPISVEGKWGFIDKTGTVKVEPQFANASPFREGLALVSVFGTSEVDQVFDRTYDGFIDESGQFVIPAEFAAFYTKREDYDSYGYSSFEDGVAVVRDASSSDGLKGIIDRKGKLIAPMVYNSFGWSFSEGLCSFETRKERGYMDYRGKVVLRPDGFLYGSGFSEGRAVITVRNDESDHELMIDRQGNVVVVSWFNGNWNMRSGELNSFWHRAGSSGILPERFFALRKHRREEGGIKRHRHPSTFHLARRSGWSSPEPYPPTKLTQSLKSTRQCK